MASSVAEHFHTVMLIPVPVVFCRCHCTNNIRLVARFTERVFFSALRRTGVFVALRFESREKINSSNISVTALDGETDH